MTDTDDPSAPYRVSRNPQQRGRSSIPRGRTALFVEAVRKAKGKEGDAYVKAWFYSGQCEFTDTAIFMFGSARSVMLRSWKHLLKDHGVSIVEDREAGRGA